MTKEIKAMIFDIIVKMEALQIEYNKLNKEKIDLLKQLDESEEE